jgi:ribosome biogenesis protein ENP2
VYHVTSGKALPAWLSEAKKRALRRDEEYRRRLELLQSFGFPSACQRLKATPDGQYIFATGYHPPMVGAWPLPVQCTACIMLLRMVLGRRRR